MDRVVGVVLKFTLIKPGLGARFEASRSSPKIVLSLLWLNSVDFKSLVLS